METELKQKIFKFGIYGEQISKLPEKLVKEARKLPWVEILSPAQLKAFKTNFSIAPVLSEYSFRAEIPADCVIRMNLQAWRAYLLGPDFITSNKHYFDIGDHLVRNPGYTSWSQLRNQYGIDPKTMHYLCKRLKERGAIEEKKEGLETFIQLGTVGGHTTQEDKQVLCDEAPADTTGLVFYKGISLIRQIAMHAEEREDGLGTKDIRDLTGVSQKISLKHLQDLCSMFPFKMVNSIEHGHTTFRVFSIENLTKRNKKKLEMMKNENPEVGDPILTARDRQEALKLLAEKHGHFVLTKQVFDEIARMTGYPYTIDRKNLIINAKIAGLKVFKLEEGAARRHVFALPTYDESVVGFYQTPPEKENRIIEDNEFWADIRKYFMEFDRFVICDNGHCEIPEVQTGILYDFLLSVTKRDEWKQIDYQVVMEMGFSKFFKIARIRRPHFLFKCAFALSQAKPSEFTENISELFIGEKEPELVNEGIYKVIEEAGEMKMREVVSKLPLDAQEVIRTATNPFRYVRRLERLKDSGVIDVKIDEQGRVFGRVLSRREEVPTACRTAIVPWGLSYNRRVEFVEGLRNATREDFWEEAEVVIRRVFSRAEQQTIKKYINLFVKTRKLPEQRSVKRKASAELREGNEFLYLQIKKILVSGARLDLSRISEGKSSDLEDVLHYMTNRRMISGYRSLASLQNVKMSSRFWNFMGDVEDLKEETSDRAYFKTIFPKVYKVVQTHGSIDMERLVSKMRYFEEFEIEAVIEQFKGDFTRREVDDFIFITVSDMKDPFDFNIY